MEANEYSKKYLAIINTVQWLKVIKYINGFVPKFALATSVLSHGLADLLLFFIFFVWSIVSFAQMFYLQLGSVMEGYSSIVLSAVTLFRALFGDFDIDAVLNTSNDWVTVGFFISYLFSAVFILLSIFLTILGEHQNYVREDQDKEKQNRKPGQSGEWGVLETIYGFSKKKVRNMLAKLPLPRFLQITSEDPGAAPDSPVSDELAPGAAAKITSQLWPQAEKPSIWSAKATLRKLDEKEHELAVQLANCTDEKRRAELQVNLDEVRGRSGASPPHAPATVHS